MPIAIGLLATCGLLSDDAREQLSKYEFIGELGLYGELRPVRGVLPAAMAVFHTGRTLIVPTENLAEALAAGGKVLGAKRLTDVVAHLASNGNLDASLQAPRRLTVSTQISLMFGDKSRHVERWRLLPQVATTSFSLVHPGQAKRCLRLGCRAYCRNLKMMLLPRWRTCTR